MAIRYWDESGVGVGKVFTVRSCGPFSNLLAGTITWTGGEGRRPWYRHIFFHLDGTHLDELLQSRSFQKLKMGRDDCSEEIGTLFLNCPVGEV